MQYQLFGGWRTLKEKLLNIIPQTLQTTLQQTIQSKREYTLALIMYVKRMSIFLGG